MMQRDLHVLKIDAKGYRENNEESNLECQQRLDADQLHENWFYESKSSLYHVDMSNISVHTPT